MAALESVRALLEELSSCYCAMIERGVENNIDTKIPARLRCTQIRVFMML